MEARKNDADAGCSRDRVYITSGYRIKPIFALRHGGEIAWRTERDGSYVTTPIVYRDYLYTCQNNGVISCYRAASGFIRSASRRERSARHRSPPTASSISRARTGRSTSCARVLSSSFCRRTAWARSRWRLLPLRKANYSFARSTISFRSAKQTRRQRDSLAPPLFFPGVAHFVGSRASPRNRLDPLRQARASSRQSAVDIEGGPWASSTGHFFVRA